MTQQENLELQIKTYDANYRAGEPICSDEAYDKLIEELKDKFPNSPLLKSGVIKQEQKSTRKQKLPIPMFSLEKCKSLEEIKKWLKSNNISDDNLLVITPKYDGISLVVDETKEKAWTRGDGEFGQQCDNHFFEIDCYATDYSIISFGEAIMPKKNFEKYKDKYSNPRNMVGGLLNRDAIGEELFDVDYIRYGTSNEMMDKSNQLVMLNNINNKKVQHILISIPFLTETLLQELYEKWSEEYKIDGLVIDIDSWKIRKNLGREENNNPKYARAYKDPKWSGSATVKVLDVKWKVSKQGKLKPVIQIEPTEVGEVIIENVTGYNARYIIDNNIARGSIISIVRSGDVIPKHISTINFNKTEVESLIDEAIVCHSCGEPTAWDSTYTELVCRNICCKEKRIAKLVHFFTTIGIEEFGEPSIESLYNNGYTTIDHILSLSNEQLCSIEGFASKSAETLLNQFKNLLEVGVPFAKTLHALDLMNGKIGEKTIQLILNNLSDDEIFGLVPFDEEKMLAIDGVAEITVNVFTLGLFTFNSTSSLYQLPINTTYTFEPKKEITGNKYENQKICFTGCRPTKEQEEEIQQQGGEVVSGVSSKTTLLVVKDMDTKTLSSSKAKKAKELGIKILTINEL